MRADIDKVTGPIFDRLSDHDTDSGMLPTIPEEDSSESTIVLMHPENSDISMRSSGKIIN